MFSAPLFHHERRASTRGRQPFLFRIVITIVLSLLALAIGLVVNAARAPDDARVRLVYFGRALLIATIGIELLFLLFFVPARVSGAIAEEREKDTLPMLLLTRLTPFEIVLTKLLARWLAVVNLVVIGVPFLVGAGWTSGLERESALALAVLLSSSAFMATISLFTSARPAQAVAARGQATGLIFGWLLGPPLLAFIPVATGSIWGDLLVELKGLAALVAPSSPVSLLTDPGWYYRTNATSLEGRVAWMIGLQALFGAVAVALAAMRLSEREKPPNWLDPTRGHRPDCGDDPIFWREFELPIRRGAGPLLLINLRLAWILIRAIVINLFALLGALINLAIPIGLLVATIYYGQAAFGELWEHGPAGTFQARGRFNGLIRTATGLLGLFPTLGLCGPIAGRIAAERDRKSWDAFLTTPLTGEEILKSKARAALHGTWLAARPLPMLWLAGLLCGVVTPIGVGLAAVDLALMAWANVGLGLYLGIRPLTNDAVSNRAALGSLACFASHAPLLWLLFASPRELAGLGTWPPLARWGLAVAGLALMIATGAVAWRLTRRTFDRFDEWVGRPIRGKVSGEARAV